MNFFGLRGRGSREELKKRDRQVAGGSHFAARKLLSGELGRACPHQGRRGQTKDGGLSCVGVHVWGESSIGLHL